MITGGIDFSAESMQALTALTLPYEKAGNNTTPIRAGHLVVRVGTSRIVARAAVTTGFVTSTTVEGFAAHDDAAARALGANGIVYGPQFAQMPTITRPGGLEQVLVFVATPSTRFRLAVKAGQFAGKAHVGKTVSIGVGTDGEIFLDTTDTTTNAIAKIIDFPQNQEGVNGGSMYFIIPSAKSSFVS